MNTKRRSSAWRRTPNKDAELCSERGFRRRFHANPRHYQTEAVDSLYQFFQGKPEGNPPCCPADGHRQSSGQLPCSFIRRFPCIVTAIRDRNPCKRTCGAKLQSRLNCGRPHLAAYTQQALKRKEAHLPITFAGIGSVAKRIEIFGHIDILMVDGAHMISHRGNRLREGDQRPEDATQT